MTDRLRAALSRWSPWAWIGKLSLLVLFVGLTNVRALKSLAATDLRLYPAHLAMWAISLAAIAIAAFAPNALVRTFWGCVLALGGAFSLAFHQATDSELIVPAALVLWVERAEAARALAFHREAAVTFVAVSLLGLAVFLCPPRARSPVLRKWLHRASFAPVVPAAIIIAFTASTGRAPRTMPRQIASLAVILESAYTIAGAAEPGRRQVVAWSPTGASRPSILVLVDESVRGDYLDFDPGNPFTPEIAALRDHIVDFGPAASATTCSNGTNAILRFMAERRSLVETLQASPTVWQYAKKAGYRTVYIDAQRFERYEEDHPPLQNHMKPAELVDVDSSHHFVTGTASFHDSDFELLELVEQELAREEPVFIYANKLGAHWPYDDNYPAEQTWFRPTMAEAEQDTAATRINSYRNNIRWAVDLFLEKLIEGTDTPDIVVLYTSDHGQTFDPGRGTHCTGMDRAPDPRHLLVPLLVVTGNEELRERFAHGARSSHGRVSHFQIAPTLLELMGYRTSDVHSVYEATLFESAPENPVAVNTSIFETLYRNPRTPPEAADERRPTPLRHAVDEPRAIAFEGMPKLYPVDLGGSYLEDLPALAPSPR